MLILKRRFITIIELLLVIGLIAIISGIVAINIRRVMLEQRFNSEVSLVVDTLRLAQDLMLIIDNEVHVKFAPLPDNRGINYWIELEKKPAEGWIRLISKPKVPLKAIRKIDFKDLLPGVATTENLIDLKFMSKGSVMSAGVMTLSSSDQKDDKNALERYICLLGFPSPIVSLSHVQCNPKNVIDYAEKLTFETQREISAKEQAKK